MIDRFRNPKVKVMQVIKSLCGKYGNALIQHPFKTKMATSAVTGIAADVTSQLFLEGKSRKDYDISRTARVVGIGALYMTPFGHIWNAHIVSRVSALFGQSKIKKTLANTALDLATISPFLLISHLFLLEATHKFDARAGINNIKDKFQLGYEFSLKFGTLNKIVTYNFIPTHYRLLYGNLIGMVFQCGVSSLIFGTPNQGTQATPQLQTSQ